MTFDELVEFIRNQGCKVSIYNAKILEQSDSMGCFIDYPEPEICMAISGYTQQELVKTILHEYAHFLQWEEGMLEPFNEERNFGWEIFNKWLKGKEFTQKTLDRARVIISLIEYDAEMRTIELSTDLGVDIGSHRAYMKDAYGYLATIKWSFLNRDWPCYYFDGELFDTDYLKPEDINKPLTQKELEKIEEEIAR